MLNNIGVKTRLYVDHELIHNNIKHDHGLLDDRSSFMDTWPIFERNVSLH